MDIMFKKSKLIVIHSEIFYTYLVYLCFLFLFFIMKQIMFLFMQLWKKDGNQVTVF